MKILLIDDHKLFSQSIKMILELSENIKKVQLVDNFRLFRRLLLMTTTLF